jgi:MraZ protein
MEDAKVPSTEIGSSGLNFIGKFACLLDAKSRLTIPRKFRRLIREDGSGERYLVICRAKDRCLDLYTSEYFARIIARLRALEAGPEKRRLIRFYSNESEQLRIDRFGRIQMPSEFLEALGASKNLVVVGALEYMEIWKSDDYGKVREEAIDGFYSGTFEP